MATMEIPESPRCEVVGVSYRMHCLKCGMVWDIYVTLGENVPDLWDICRNCLNILNNMGKDNTSTPEKYKYTKVLAKYPYLNRG